jgi:hypothetical protein
MHYFQTHILRLPETKERKRATGRWNYDDPLGRKQHIFHLSGYCKEPKNEEFLLDPGMYCGEVGRCRRGKENEEMRDTISRQESQRVINVMDLTKGEGIRYD